MQISKRCEYAIRAVLAIALAHGSGREQIALAELSREERIPLKFLEQILLTLKNGGLLRSKRGVGGGYQFLKAPARISLGEVINLIDGTFIPLPCAASDGGTCDCGINGSCGLGQTFNQLREQVNTWLNTTTLAHVLEREQNKTVSFEI